MNSFSKTKTKEQKVSNQEINIIVNEHNNKISELQNKIEKQEKSITLITNLLHKQSYLLESLNEQINQLKLVNDKHVELRDSSAESAPLCIQTELKKILHEKAINKHGTTDETTPKLSIEKIPPISFLSK